MSASVVSTMSCLRSKYGLRRFLTISDSVYARARLNGNANQGPTKRGPVRQDRPARSFAISPIRRLATAQNYRTAQVDVLKEKHIMVVGHYGCGGVSAAVDGQRRGLVGHWLHPIPEVAHAHRSELDVIAEPRIRPDGLCEAQRHPAGSKHRVGRLRRRRMGTWSEALRARLDLLYCERPIRL
jgi:hypothetical protein